MTTLKAICWNNEIEIDLMSIQNAPYYIAGFLSKPQFIPDTLVLQNGESLEVGDTIAYLGGKRRGATYEQLYPVSPMLFRFEGRIVTLSGDAYALWTPITPDGGIDLSHPDYAMVCIAHSLMDDGSLLFTLPGGAGRVIETEICFRTHEEIPEMFAKEARMPKIETKSQRGCVEACA